MLLVTACHASCSDPRANIELQRKTSIAAVMTREEDTDAHVFACVRVVGRVFRVAGVA